MVDIWSYDYDPPLRSKGAQEKACAIIERAIKDYQALRWELVNTGYNHDLRYNSEGKETYIQNGVEYSTEPKPSVSQISSSADRVILSMIKDPDDIRQTNLLADMIRLYNLSGCQELQNND